jgi:hypothetical protein
VSQQSPNDPGSDSTSDQISADLSDAKSLTPGEHTPNLEPGKAQSPKGQPWLDYFPPIKKPTPQNLEEHIELMLADKNMILADKEDLKIRCLSLKIHKAYYRHWVRDCNRLFRLTARLKRRNTKPSRLHI